MDCFALAASYTRPRRACLGGAQDWQLQQCLAVLSHFRRRRPALRAGRRRRKCDPWLEEKRRLVVNPGLRWDKPSGGGKNHIHPRASTKIVLGDWPWIHNYIPLYSYQRKEN